MMYQSKIKRLLLIFFLTTLIISYTSMLIFTQALDEKEEKQLKIFQLSNVLEKENSFPQQSAYFNNALAYYHQEHFSFAIRELEKIEYSNLYIPLYLKSQLLKGKCYEKLERWESSLYIYQELIATVPLMQDYVLYFLSKVYLNMNDTMNAMESFQQVVEEHPGSPLVPLARYQIALIFLKNDQLEQFLQECRLAVQLSFEEQFKAQVLRRMSDVLWEEGSFVDSLIQLKELLEKRYDREYVSRDEDLYVKRYQMAKETEKGEILPELSLFCAGVLFNYRQYKMAETLYEEVIRLYPEQIDLAQVYYNKARTIHYQGEYESAIEQCNYILRTFNIPDIIIRTLYLYAGALLSSGNRSEAIEKYQEIITGYPESYFAQSSYLRLSEIEFLREREEEGINILNRLISEYPQSDQAREASWKLARHYTNKNEIQDALKYYQLIYDRFPQSSQGDDALYWLGKLYYPLDKEKGIRWYRILLNQFPDSYYAFHIPGEEREDYHNLKSIISQARENSLEEFRNNYFPEDSEAQLSVYEAELLQVIGFYQESVLEIVQVLNRESGNAYLMYLLTEVFYQNSEYYRSIGWAQILLSHFLSNNMIEQMPFKIWEYAFPVHYSSIINVLATDYDLDPFLVWSTIREESHFNRYAESRAGARGLMQIILSTGEWIAQKVDYQDFDYDLLFEPGVNIHFGCWYLNYLQEKFNKRDYLMISGYNAGPGITDQWIESIDMNDIDSFIENIPYQETTEHIKKVMRTYIIYQIIYQNKKIEPQTSSLTN